MVRAPTFPEGEERRGRRNALLHLLERRKVLNACERVIVEQRGAPLGGRERRRLRWGADVLLWKDRAFVRRPSYFSVVRDADGRWRATYIVF
jgi:hypothetical protein